MADGPVGYWRLGDSPGSKTAVDSTANAQTGDVSGGVTFGLPCFHGGDTAAFFDGATCRNIGNNSDPLNPAHITMEAKVRWDGPTNQYQRIIEKSSFPELAQYGFGIFPDGHVHVELRTSSATTSVNVASAGVAVQGAETHVVATYDGLMIRIYLNGVLDSQTPAPGSISPSPRQFDRERRRTGHRCRVYRCWRTKVRRNAAYRARPGAAPRRRSAKRLRTVRIATREDKIGYPEGRKLQGLTTQ